MNTQVHSTEPSGEAVQRAAVEGAAHTPGPWDVVETPADREVDYNGDHLIVWRANGNVIAKLEHYSPAERRANANVIAAAPELLEVARLLSLATDEGDDAAQGTHYIDKRGRIRCKGSFLETIEKARAALARAKGGAA